MIEEHVDPTTETHAQITNLIRTLVTAAAGVAEKRAQRREAEQREAARQSDIARHAFEERIRAEREIAYLIYRNVERDRWWERATPKDIADTVEVAGTWANTDPRAQAALNRIQEELHHRYGIDLQDGATPAEVLDQVETAKQAAQGAATSKQEHTGGPGRQPWEQEILDAAGAELGSKVIASEGWPQLQNRLGHLHASGIDVHERLHNAVNERELDTAVDKAITLVWRLKPGPLTPAQTKAAKSAAKGSRPGKSTKSEGDPERFAKRKMAIEHPRDSGPEPTAGR